MSRQYNTIKKDVPHIFIQAPCPLLPEKHHPLPYIGGFYAQLSARLDFDQNDPPIAAILGGDYIVSPIRWEASHNNAFIAAQGDGLHLSRNKSLTYCEALAQFLAEEGLRLTFIDTYTWLLQMDSGKPSLTAAPVYQMQHVPLINTIESLDPTQYWQRLHTEIQMFFHRKAIEDINGVWIWGGARIEKRSIIPIIADKASLPLAEKLSENVTLYPGKNRYRNSTLLFKSAPKPALVFPQGSRWFWENYAYFVPPSSRWSSFLEKIFPCK